jgi:hypothetical protein
MEATDIRPTERQTIAQCVADLAVVVARLSHLVGGEPEPVRPGVAPPSPPDPDGLAAHLARVTREHQRQGQAVEREAFTPEQSGQFASRRFRDLLRASGITQKELAARLGVAPSALNRVLKNPERSKLATLRRIAAELGREVGQVV